MRALCSKRHSYQEKEKCEKVGSFMITIPLIAKSGETDEMNSLASFSSQLSGRRLFDK